MARGTKAASAPVKKSAATAKATAGKAATSTTSAKGGSKASAAAPAKKAAVKTAPAKKTAAKAAPAKKTAAKAAPAKKTAAKAAPATKAAAPAKKAAAPAKKAASSKSAAAAPAKTGSTSSKKTRSPFSAKFLAAQERLLYEERATYMRQFESLRAEAASLVEDFESGDVQFDEESGEGDTINIERERDLALSEQARAAVGEIDHALSKLPLGTYGICEVSGEPIPAERLEAIPWARERVEFKTGGLTRR